MAKKEYTSIAALLFISMGYLHAQPNLAGGRTMVKLTETTIPKNNGTSSTNISGIKVVTALPDSTVVGYLPKARGNETVKLVPEDKISSWLQAYVDKQYGSLYSKNGKRVIWVIEKLGIGGDTSATKAFTSIKAGLYENTGTGQLTLLSVTDTLITTDPPGNVKDLYSAAITSAIQALYNNSIAAISKQTLQDLRSAEIITVEGLVSSIKQKRNLPILRDSFHNPGVYLTFTEFKNNQPSIKHGFATVDSRDSTKIKIMQRVDSSTVREVLGAWGLCTNREMYALKDGKLIAIEVSNNSIVVSRFQEPPTRKNQAMYWRRYMGERTGDINPFGRQHSYLAKDKASLQLPNPPEATNIDLETGELSF